MQEEKKEKTENLQYAIIKARRATLGNIRFIGELFKLGMLTEKIMHDECIMKLLRDTEPESLECLCKLLMTIGVRLDTVKSKVCRKSPKLTAKHVIVHTAKLSLRPTYSPCRLQNFFCQKQIAGMFILRRAPYQRGGSQSHATPSHSLRFYFVLYLSSVVLFKKCCPVSEPHGSVFPSHRATE